MHEYIFPYCNMQDGKYKMNSLWLVSGRFRQVLPFFLNFPGSVLAGCSQGQQDYWSCSAGQRATDTTGRNLHTISHEPLKFWSCIYESLDLIGLITDVSEIIHIYTAWFSLSFWQCLLRANKSSDQSLFKHWGWLFIGCEVDISVCITLTGIEVAGSPHTWVVIYVIRYT